MVKLIILDRDGVINHDSGSYIKTPSEWIPISGSLQAIAALNDAGWTVAVATNQSGLARGFLDTKALYNIHKTMHIALSEHHGEINYLVWCPHGPNDQCDCRKPKPGLYQQIAAHFHCSLYQVPVIGDSTRDLEAAVAVGAKPILVKTGKGQRAFAEDQLPPGTLIYDDLQAAVNSLIASYEPYEFD